MTIADLLCLNKHIRYILNIATKQFLLEININNKNCTCFMLNNNLSAVM